ncbi:MAG: hypothetical protein WBQ79_02805 [Acidobacteriaceae bacterium]
MPPIRSRAEIVLLWAQLILVLGDALAIAQGWAWANGIGVQHGWVTLVPLVCVLPSAAAFRETWAAAIGVTAGAVASLAAIAWSLSPHSGGSGWGAMLSGLAVSFNLTWPLFVAAGMLFAVMRVRVDREREASRLHRHTRANQMELEASEVCGCIACERIYFPSEIVRWLDDGTAMCPHCGVDAVVGSASGIPIMPGVLRRAHERWFLVG